MKCTQLQRTRRVTLLAFVEQTPNLSEKGLTDQRFHHQGPNPQLLQGLIRYQIGIPSHKVTTLAAAPRTYFMAFFTKKFEKVATAIPTGALIQPERLRLTIEKHNIARLRLEYEVQHGGPDGWQAGQISCRKVKYCSP